MSILFHLYRMKKLHDVFRQLEIVITTYDMEYKRWKQKHFWGAIYAG